MSWGAAFLLAGLLSGVSMWLLLRRRERVGWLVAGIAATIIAVWLAFAVLASAQVHDADGFIDCWPNCTTWQNVVKAVIWGGPVALAGLGFGLVLARAPRHRRH